MPSSVNRLFLIDSSFAKKSHLSRIQWFEELGQVRSKTTQGELRSGKGWLATPSQGFLWLQIAGGLGWFFSPTRSGLT